ncbi:CorA-like Mg2+ transporter [Apiospora kogelbergensis]|uniref:CorA-like Mg2+ transporter n=1 Tax=Apiospora kogelbergensis TaxID=1337665 RepID=A0AAW0Q537_9PEZI
MASSGNPFAPLNQPKPTVAGPSQATPAASSNVSPGSQVPKKKKHRGGRKHRRPRRKSFAAPADEEGGPSSPRRNGNESPPTRPNDFYMRGRNLSNTSIESEALLDHREHPWGSRPRRPSTILAASFQLSRSGENQQTPRPRTAYNNTNPMEDVHVEEDPEDVARMSESAPLLPGTDRTDSSSKVYGSNDGIGSWGARQRRESLHRGSSKSSWRGNSGLLGPPTPGTERYNVNYPPSMPGSPRMGGMDRMDVNFGDELMLDQLASASKDDVNSLGDEDTGDVLQGSPNFQRRHTIALEAQEDVCFPQEGMSEIADDELNQARDQRNNMRRRRRREKWPDLSILEEWSRMEVEGRSDERRIKKITEPQLINGRLRPIHKGWFRAEEDAPYRFTYFNEEFQSTIHSQTISELVQPDASFKDLFVPERPILSDSSESDDDDELEQMPTITNPHISSSLRNGGPCRRCHLCPSPISGEGTPMGFPMGFKSPATKSPSPRPEKPIRYGDRPVWWLDVLSPTEAEMKVIQKTFGIHPLTSEDIMLREQREKVELFRHYYFVNYRSFDQDADSATHLDPVDLYLVVFREGVISFHFQQTPHPANVRRRIRQLKDYMVLSADWISYAIIDDITDVFVPLIQKIEEEVDDIDDAILMSHRGGGPDGEDNRLRDGRKDKDASEKKSIAGDTLAEVPSDGDMLKRVGSCRKKVMVLYRLLGNKADVIKGFAKRCNEHWEVAPRSEIGLYLGDIQDHIVTMTSNLSHYEVILARSHGNYLAQINIRMNERSEQTADTLGKLTVLGTIVLPMNIITGLWGMNVWVPGQEYEGDLVWFWCITAGLLMFGLGCFFIAKRVYKIV